MRRLLHLMTAILLLALTPAVKADEHSVTAYVNANWWTGAGFAAGDRFIRDGRFVRSSRRAATQTVDLKGAHVVPPFADAHNHMVGKAADMSAKAMHAGVYYLMNPTLLASGAPRLRAMLAEMDGVEAQLAMGAITAPGGHPEALYMDTLRPYAYPDKKLEDFTGDAFHFVTRQQEIAPVLDRLAGQGADFVKIVLMHSETFEKRRDDPAYRGRKGLDPRLIAPIVKAAHRRGLRVVAHIETAADFCVIVRAGVDAAAHMPGYYGGIGPVGDYAITPADAAAARRSGIRMIATASYALNNPDKAALPPIQAMQRANLMLLKRAGVPILIGTDGVADAAPAEARYLIDLGVLSPAEALEALAGATPRFVYPARRIGRLAPGYEASFLVLRGDPLRDWGTVGAIERRVRKGRELGH